MSKAKPLVDVLDIEELERSSDLRKDPDSSSLTLLSVQEEVATQYLIPNWLLACISFLGLYRRRYIRVGIYLVLHIGLMVTLWFHTDRTWVITVIGTMQSTAHIVNILCFVRALNSDSFRSYLRRSDLRPKLNSKLRRHAGFLTVFCIAYLGSQQRGNTYFNITALPDDYGGYDILFLMFYYATICLQRIYICFISLTYYAWSEILTADAKKFVAEIKNTPAWDLDSMRQIEARFEELLKRINCTMKEIRTSFVAFNFWLLCFFTFDAIEEAGETSDVIYAVLWFPGLALFITHAVALPWYGFGRVTTALQRTKTFTRYLDVHESQYPQHILLLRAKFVDTDPSFKLSLDYQQVGGVKISFQKANVVALTAFASQCGGYFWNHFISLHI